MKRLTQKEKKYLDDVNLERAALRLDLRRRLRNAILALAAMDPGWLVWIEQHIPAEIDDLHTVTRLVEKRARSLVVQSYKHLGGAVLQNIINGDRIFADDGSLVM